MSPILAFRGGFPNAAVQPLRAGEPVELTGPVLTLRDASAARLARALADGRATPVPLAGRVLYAVGPSPARPGQVVGSAGPTTTGRMARYLPALFSAGVRAVIGKGELHGEDMRPFVASGAVYFGATGGTGALLARRITSSTVVAYEDLGPEALYLFDLERFPAVVIIDIHGHNFHAQARDTWRRRGPAKR